MLIPRKASPFAFWDTFATILTKFVNKFFMIFCFFMLVDYLFGFIFSLAISNSFAVRSTTSSNWYDATPSGFCISLSDHSTTVLSFDLQITRPTDGLQKLVALAIRHQLGEQIRPQLGDDLFQPLIVQQAAAIFDRDILQQLAAIL